MGLYYRDKIFVVKCDILGIKTRKYVRMKWRVLRHGGMIDQTIPR